MTNRSIHILLIALLLVVPSKKRLKRQKPAKPKHMDTVIYRVIPGCVECRATGYYKEGTEPGNGNQKKGKE